MGSTGGQAAQAGGTILTAYGKYREGKDTGNAYKYNEAVMQREQEMIGRSAQIQQNQISRQKGKTLATQHARYAKSGVVTTSGSPYEVAVDTAGQYEMDKAIVAYNAEVERRRAAAMQAQYGKAAKNAYQAGLVGAGSSLLQGFAQQMK
jgi:hypothetical protein